MSFKVLAACLLVVVVGANAGILSGLGISIPTPPPIIGGLINKTTSIGGNIIGTVTDGVNKGVTDTANVLTGVADEAKNLLKSFEGADICKCSGLTCGCCADATLMKIQNKFCVNIGVSPMDLAIKVSANFNEKTLFSSQITGKNPPPICAPLGPLPAVTFCVRPYQMSLALQGFRVCIQLETAAFGKTLATASLNCFRISSTGSLTMETVEENPDKGYLNLNVSSILPYLPERMKQPINLPVYPLSLLTGK